MLRTSLWPLYSGEADVGMGVYYCVLLDYPRKYMLRGHQSSMLLF